MSALEDPSLPPPSTFHLFPSLPTELRNHIWFLALPEPRIFTLLESDDSQSFLIKCRCYQKDHPLLSTSSEARSVYLSVYHRLYFGKVHESLAPYVDPERDTIRLYRHATYVLLELLGKLEGRPLDSLVLQRLRLLRLDSEGISDILFRLPTKHVILGLLRTFPALKELQWNLVGRIDEESRILYMETWHRPIDTYVLRLPEDKDKLAAIQNATLGAIRGTVEDFCRRHENEYPGLTVPTMSIYPDTVSAEWEFA